MSERVCSAINFLVLLHLMSLCHCIYVNSRVCLLRENKRHTSKQNVTHVLCGLKQKYLKVQTVNVSECLKQTLKLESSYCIFFNAVFWVLFGCFCPRWSLCLYSFVSVSHKMPPKQNTNPCCASPYFESCMAPSVCWPISLPLQPPEQHVWGMCHKSSLLHIRQ